MLIIVESPTKAKKIQSILQRETMSTVGHFKDLPEANIGVDLSTYEPTFVYHEKKLIFPRSFVRRHAARPSMLAGDPDREGYAISCHIYEEVKDVAKECLRMEIFEVTEKGLKESLARACRSNRQTPASTTPSWDGESATGWSVISSLRSPVNVSAAPTASDGSNPRRSAWLLIVKREIRNFNSSP